MSIFVYIAFFFFAMFSFVFSFSIVYFPYVIAFYRIFLKYITWLFTRTFFITYNFSSCKFFQYILCYIHNLLRSQTKLHCFPFTVFLYFFNIKLFFVCGIFFYFKNCKIKCAKGVHDILIRFVRNIMTH